MAEIKLVWDLGIAFNSIYFAVIFEKVSAKPYIVSFVPLVIPYSADSFDSSPPCSSVCQSCKSNLTTKFLPPHISSLSTALRQQRSFLASSLLLIVPIIAIIWLNWLMICPDFINNSLADAWEETDASRLFCLTMPDMIVTYSCIFCLGTELWIAASQKFYLLDPYLGKKKSEDVESLQFSSSCLCK